MGDPEGGEGQPLCGGVMESFGIVRKRERSVEMDGAAGPAPTGEAGSTPAWYSPVRIRAAVLLNRSWDVSPLRSYGW
jgi:hypothetical protein